MTPLPDPSSGSDLAARLARLEGQILVQPESVRAEVEEILAQARQGGAWPQEALCLMHLARCDFLQGRYAPMMNHAQEALSLARQVQAVSTETRCLNLIGLAHHRQGALDQAMRFFLDGLRLAQQTQDHEASALVLSNIGMIYTNLQEPGMALRLNEQAMEIAQSVGSAPLTANLLTSVTRNYFELGQYERVLEIGLEAVAFSHAHGLSRIECYARINLSNTLLRLGRIDASLRVTHVGLRVARWTKDSEMIAQFCTIEGSALTALREFRQAEVRLREALDLSVQAGHLEQEVRTRQALSELYAAQGDEQIASLEQQQYRLVQEKLLGEADLTRTQQAVAQLREVPEQAGSAEQYVWTAELLELTRTLKRANLEQAYRAAHDPLTGALNLPHFQMRVQKQLDALGPNEILGVVVVGVDDLSTLKQQYGSATGDCLLTETSQRLQRVLRPGDLVGRLGSDQFIVLLDYLAREGDLERVMHKMLSALHEPVLVREEPLSLKASLGGVLAPRDAQNLEVIVTNASLAMQQVREAGGRDVRVYQPQPTEAEQQRRTLLYDLRTADYGRDFTVHYQPQFHLPNLTLAGAEALVRWQHPRLGLLSPSLFIPLAEESRAILDIGDGVLRAACQQARAWAFPERSLIMSVNVSTVQFSQPNFVLGVRAALESAGLPGEALVLELTESMVQSHQALALDHMAALKDLGVRVALDDFGTGFSSLSMLQNLPFQVLKIDRSFLRGLEAPQPEAERARLLIDVTVNLARNLQMDVVAEGVETATQLKLISRLGCQQAQGYLLGRPTPPDEFKSLLSLEQDGVSGHHLNDHLN